MLRRGNGMLGLMLVLGSLPVAAGQPVRVLFVGNSFFYGAVSAAEQYRPESVHDLNGSGYGGVPAIFKRFTEEAGI